MGVFCGANLCNLQILQLPVSQRYIIADVTGGFTTTNTGSCCRLQADKQHKRCLKMQKSPTLTEAQGRLISSQVSTNISHLDAKSPFTLMGGVWDR